MFGQFAIRADSPWRRLTLVVELDEALLVLGDLGTGGRVVQLALQQRHLPADRRDLTTRSANRCHH